MWRPCLIDKEALRRMDPFECTHLNTTKDYVYEVLTNGDRYDVGTYAEIEEGTIYARITCIGYNLFNIWISDKELGIHMVEFAVYGLKRALNKAQAMAAGVLDSPIQAARVKECLATVCTNKRFVVDL